MDVWGLPPGLSTFSDDVDFLYKVILVITGIAFLATEGLLLWFLWRYRAREGGRAVHVHTNHRLETFWTVGTGLALFALAVYQYGTWSEMKRELPLPEESVQVELSPRQFLWAVRYPGEDNQFGTDDDITAPNNVIHVPVDEPVLVTLVAQDVIHSFFVPFLRVKQDAMPGSVMRTWFQATEIGEYDVACTELCGQQHYDMNATLTVESREDFEAWLAERRARQEQGAAGVDDGALAAAGAPEEGRGD